MSRRCNAWQCGAEWPIPASATLCIDGRGEVGQNLEHAVELFQSGTHGPAGALAHLGASLPQPWESASQMRPATAPCSVPTLRHRVTRMLRPSWASATRKASGARLMRRWEVSCPLLNRPSPLNLEQCVRCTEKRKARLGSTALRALRQAGQANPLKRNPDRLLRAVPALCSVLVRQGSSARPLGRLLDEPCPSRMQELVRCRRSELRSSSEPVTP